MDQSLQRTYFLDSKRRSMVVAIYSTMDPIVPVFALALLLSMGHLLCQSFRSMGLLEVENNFIKNQLILRLMPSIEKGIWRGQTFYGVSSAQHMHWLF